MERATRFRVARATPVSLRSSSRPAPETAGERASCSGFGPWRLAARAIPVFVAIGGLLAFVGDARALDSVPSAKPVVTIEAGPTPVTEGTAAEFVVSRSGSTKEALTVSLGVAETGSMISGTAPTSIVLMGGEEQKRLAVSTQADDRDEAASSVTVTLTAGEDAEYEVGADSSATVLVEDDDDLQILPVITVEPESTPVAEGEEALFVVRRAGPAEEALEVSAELSVTGSFAFSGGPRTMTLRMEPESRLLSFGLLTNGNDRDEADGNVTLKVMAPEDASYEVGSPSSAMVVVEDDDDLEVQVTTAVVDANGVAVTEVPEDVGTATIRVTATTVGSVAPTEAFGVAVSTRSDSAVSPDDYGALSVMVHFAVADWVFMDAEDRYSAVKEVLLSIVDDSVDEEAETLGLLIERAPDTPAYVSLPGRVELAIVDNDAVPGAPTDLVATAAERNAIDLSWNMLAGTTNPPITGYRIEWSGDGASDWTDLVEDTETSTTTYTAGGLEPGTTRHYRVSAINLVGTGPASDPAGATTDGGEPAEVRVTTAVLDANGVVVTEVPEDIGTATIRVTATTGGSPAPTSDFNVSVSTRAGSAVSPDDYAPLSVEIGYAAADWVFVAAEGNYEAVKDVSLTIVDDSVQELEPETLGLITERAPNTPTYVSFPPRLELAIVDNDSVPVEPPDPDLPEVTFSGSTPEVIEGAEVTFTLSRAGDSSASLTVSVEVSETGSMIRGAAPTSAVFDAGAARTTLAVRTVDDSVDERNSVITVTLTAGQAAFYVVGSASSAAVTVKDDDEPPPAVTVPAAPKNLAARADGEARIDLAWTAPTETGGVAITGYRIEWSPDGDSGWSVLVDDTGTTGTTYSDRGLTAGTTRHYRVCALNSAGIGPPSNIIGAVTNLAPPEVTVRAVQSPVVEGAEVAFTLRRAGATAEPLTVSLEVTATAPMIGGESPTSALFPGGADETTLTVRTIDDRVDEPDREIVATLLSGSGYTLGSAASATVQVRDNDAAPVLAIANASAPESRGDLMFQVTLQGQSSMPVEVGWSTSPGSATADQDYAAVSGVLTLDPGSASAAIVIPLRDDALFEENETFTVSLSRPRNAKLRVGASLATGVIENDDAAPVFRIADASAPESAAEIAFTVSLSGESAMPATVRWTSSAATAQPGLDYIEASGELTFAPGTTSRRIAVRLLEDLLVEEAETFRMSLSEATNAAFEAGSVVAATGTIEDDDDTAPAEEWLARFGRTAASNAVDAVEDRLTGRLGSGAQVVVAGHRVDVSGSDREHGATGSGQGSGAGGSAPAPVAGLGGIGQAAGGAVGLAGSGGGLLDAQSGRYGSGRMDAGVVLARSSFQFSSDSHASGYSNRATANGAAHGADAGGHRWSVWGRGAATRFDGGEDTLSLDGEVVTGTVGADVERGRVLFGVAVSHSRGDGDYRRAGGGGLRAREGDLSSDLTTGLPYLRVAVNDRLAVWGALGRGSGSMTLSEGDLARQNSRRSALRAGCRPEGRRTQCLPRKPLGSIEADIGMSLGAFGARQELRSSAATDGFSLALRTDLLLVHTTSDETEALPALSTDVNRLRFMIEGARRFQFESGAVLTPKVELGLRYDDGDAETGGGLELGAGLRFENAARGLSAELTGRSLLATKRANSRSGAWAVRSGSSRAAATVACPSGCGRRWAPRRAGSSGCGSSRTRRPRATARRRRVARRRRKSDTGWPCWAAGGV